ncbi:MAG: phosphoenolpyruvate--protein phosphotransferase, partial [Balneolales bacterium]|nr:phosphoenolpyruvate--protein phosphotransferase [Balneolales bacterium]
MNNELSTQLTVKGLTGSDGIAIGSVLVVNEKKKVVQPTKIRSTEIRLHLERFAKAKERAVQELDAILQNLDSSSAEIIEAQKHIISDEEIVRRVNHLIEIQSFSVDFAIYDTFSGFIERLKESGSELFQQRIIDLENLRDRLIALSCENENQINVEKGAILIAKEISPTDLVSYHEKGVTGLVLDKGGITSHAAIIAQSLNLPCIVSAKRAVKSSLNTKKAILNATEGRLILNPDKETLAEFKNRIKEANKQQRATLRTSDRSETKDGKPFTLSANMEFVQEIPFVKKSKAKGIGLLRTEALLYGGIENRKEEKQDQFYNIILHKTKGPVTIRLFDVGGDKLSVVAKEEDNPFLGWRGIRMLLDEKEILHTQLRSVLKVSGKYPGRVRILVPMVSSVEEIRQVKSEMEFVERQLLEEGVPTDTKIKIGVMVEVPSVAMLAKHFAKEVDFFSVGTNDLTQYTLAVDRGNERISSLYQHYHPSVWQLIKVTHEAALEQGIEMSVCGELAGDLV